MTQPAQVAPQKPGESDATESRVLALELVVLAAGHEDFRAAAMAVVTEMATRLGCERVSLGVPRKGRMRIEALSHSADFDPRAALARDLGRALDEACDQDTTVGFPAAPGATPQLTRAHAELARSHGAGAVCSVPVASRGRIVAAFCFELRWGREIDAETSRRFQEVAAVIGPALELARSADVGAFARAAASTRRALAHLLGPDRTTQKACLAATMLLVAMLALARGEHRVKASATLEGRVQQAIVAGIDGYVAESQARAGDVVERGRLLGRLDDRELRLEQRRWSGRAEQLRKEQREALASFDRSELRIAAAKLEQAEAQLALLEENLARTRLVAPFDGVVVRGDLSQSLGSPVARGAVLFEVAPLDGYRIILEVDERDVSYTAAGQSGRLGLSALPGETLSFAVERVARVASTEEGRSHFRVEARLVDPPEALRPGMEGVAKISVGRRGLLWIWTHRMWDWLRLFCWSWWP